jgi:CRP-like cAMP-binding protein
LINAPANIECILVVGSRAIVRRQSRLLLLASNERFTECQRHRFIDVGRLIAAVLQLEPFRAAGDEISVPSTARGGNTGSGRRLAVADLGKPPFNTDAFLTSAGLGRRIVQLAPKEPFFSQGDPADCIFYLQKGSARVTVVSQTGKEATITLISAGDFVGEESLAAVPGLRLSTATALTACTALKIRREEMVRVMHEEHDFSDRFIGFLLVRSMRMQADLVDQLFNSSEKRLARILLLMAEFGQPGGPETLIPKVSQETLAEMIGTTRSRVSFFMNRFRKLGFIEYNGRIRVHKSLLNVVLHDRLPGDDIEKSPHPGVSGS